MASVTIQDKLMLDGRLAIDAPVTYAIRRGPANSTRQVQSASSISNSGVQYDVQLNNASNIVSDYMVQKLTIQCTVSAASNGQNVGDYLLTQGQFALRQYPIASVTNSSTLQLNNQQSSCNPYQFIHELMLFQNQSKSPITTSCQQSLCPTFPDQSQTYNDALGSIKNPLGSYFGASDHYSESRGSWNARFNVISSTQTQLVFNVDLYEPVINPLLSYEPTSMDAGFWGLTQLQLQYNFLSNLSRMFSFNSAAFPNITNISVGVLAAELHMFWLTAPLDLPKPQIQIKGFNKIVVNTSQPAAPVAPGATAVLQSQTLSLSNIPNKIWVYVKRSNYDVAGVPGCALTDTWFEITNINVLFDNKSALLANYGDNELYDQLVAGEGSQQTFIQWSRYQGGVCTLDPSRDFGLQDDQAPGVFASGGGFQLQIQVTCKNLHPTDTITPAVYIVQAIPSIFTSMQNGVSTIQEGVLQPQEIANAMSLPTVPSYYRHDDIYGGKISDKLKEFGRKALGFIKENKLVSKGLAMIPHPAAQTAAQVASQVGYGRVNKRNLAKSLRM